MISKRKIAHYITVLLLAAAVIVVGVATSRRASNPACAAITVIVKDSAERQYVTPAELQQQLLQAGLWPIGETLSNISCHLIEQNLLTHPMLKQAECYKLAKGELKIIVRQRHPLMLVKGDESYYIDTDRKPMPVRASVNTPVVTVSGHIGRQQAQTEMFDFVCWLNRSGYWREKIHHIRVSNPKTVELIDDEHHYTILLGSMNNAADRLNQLEKLYEKGFARIGFPHYKQIDLQYNGQIIGRK